MSVRQNNSSAATTTTMQQAPSIVPQTMDVSEVAADTALAEGNNYNVVNAEQPLKRNVVVSIKSTLNDLCLQVSLFSLLNLLVFMFVYITLVD